jgi:hypothetical protein
MPARSSQFIETIDVWMPSSASFAFICLKTYYVQTRYYFAREYLFLMVAIAVIPSDHRFKVGRQRTSRSAIGSLVACSSCSPASMLVGVARLDSRLVVCSLTCSPPPVLRRSVVLAPASGRSLACRSATSSPESGPGERASEREGVRRSREGEGTACRVCEAHSSRPARSLHLTRDDRSLTRPGAHGGGADGWNGAASRVEADQHQMQMIQTASDTNVGHSALHRLIAVCSCEIHARFNL